MLLDGINEKNAFIKHYLITHKYICETNPSYRSNLNLNALVHSLLLKIITLFLIQSKGFFHDDKNYLINKIKDIGKDNFYTTFLIPFTNSLTNSTNLDEITKQVIKFDKQFLNFNQEAKFLKLINEHFYKKDISINDEKLPIFNFLNHYTWNIDENGPDNKCIKPNILSYILEKEIMKKEYGSIYTGDFYAKFIIEKSLEYSLFESGDNQLPNLVDRINNLKILDPSCGSGQFLLNFLFILEKLLLSNTITSEDNIELEKRKIRWNLVSNNLFGIDLQPEIIKILKLRIYLTIIATYNSKDTIIHLPVLDSNFKTGNTILGYNSTKTIKDNSFTNKLREQLDCHNLSDRNFEEKFRPFHWYKEFPDIFQKNNERSGFDIVIGNPPYIRSRNIDPQEREFYKVLYESAWRTFDVYLFFIELSIKFLLKQGQIFSFLVPYSLLNQPYAKKLRKLMLDNLSILEIVDLSSEYIFNSVLVRNVIIICRKKKSSRDTLSSVIKDRIYEKVAMVNKATFSTNIDYFFNLALNKQNKELIKRIDDNSIPLSELLYISKGIEVYERNSGKTKSEFIHQDNKDGLYKNYLEGKEIEKYKITWKGRYLDYQPNLHCSGKFPELFEKPKILLKRIIGKKGIIATVDIENYYVENTLICLVQKHILEEHRTSNNQSDTFRKKFKTGFSENELNLSKKYNLYFILGILNSSLLSWYFLVKHSDKLQIYNQTIKSLPIIIKRKNEDKVVEYVQKLLNIKGRNENSEEILKKVDDLVFDLYNISKKEKNLILRYLTKNTS